MSNDSKKISFSFSKVKKPSLVNKVNIESKEKVEYVDCFDGSKGKFSYKGNVRNNDVQKQELVIPMPTSRTSADIIRSRIEEKVNKNVELIQNSKREDIKSQESNASSNQSGSIEELAALEILTEIKNGNIKNETSSKLIIEANEVPKEPSEADIDYENIPVTDFGLALLRGMGWKPNLGIGKEPRLVESVSPKPRPRGLGLGAQPNPETNSDKQDKKKSNKVSTSDKKSDKKSAK